jgi:hypothetical protein
MASLVHARHRPDRLVVSTRARDGRPAAPPAPTTSIAPAAAGAAAPSSGPLGWEVGLREEVRERRSCASAAPQRQHLTEMPRCRYSPPMGRSSRSARHCRRSPRKARRRRFAPRLGSAQEFAPSMQRRVTEHFDLDRCHRSAHRQTKALRSAYPAHLRCKGGG